MVGGVPGALSLTITLPMDDIPALTAIKVKIGRSTALTFRSTSPPALPPLPPQYDLTSLWGDGFTFRPAPMDDSGPGGEEVPPAPQVGPLQLSGVDFLMSDPSPAPAEHSGEPSSSPSAHDGSAPL
jgi:hypothetical protein